MDDLLNGANIAFIRKDRGRRGGGVAICYDPTKMSMKNYPVPQLDKKTEIVCALGNTSLTKRKIALVSVYMPPSITREELDSYIYTLVTLVDSIKSKHEDCIFFIGGDFNKKDLDRFCTAFPDLKPLLTGATRRGLALDEIYSNMTDHIASKEILKPLCKENGVLSDHSIIAAAIKLPKNKKARNITFSFRPITERGTVAFGKLLEDYDWSLIERPSSTETANALNAVLQSFVDRCFDLKERKIKSTDAPWFTPTARKAVNRKIRIYRREGKSERYHVARKQCDVILRKEKEKFWDKVITKTGNDRNSSEYYKAVNVFKSRDVIPPWNISVLFPEEDDYAISEAVAVFFNKISVEYEPIPDPKVIEDYQVQPILEQ